MSRIDKIFWGFLPVVFYFAAFLGSWYTVILLAPYFIYGAFFAVSNGLKVTRSNIYIYLYIISIVITNLIKNFFGAVYSLLTLILFINIYQIKISSAKKISDCLKYLIVGTLFIALYHVLVFLNFGGELVVMGFRNLNHSSIDSIQNYIQTTQDGPILFAVILCFIIVSLKLTQNKFKQIGFINILNFTIFITIISSILFVLLVYNRRVMILAVIFIIALYYLGIYKKVWIYEYSIFLPYIGFLILGILLISFNLKDIFEGLLNRTDDLQEDNVRLIAWSIALGEYKNLGIKDMFMFSKEINFFNESEHSHPHNGFLQIIYERGIFGITTFILLCFMVFKEIRKIKIFNNTTYSILLIILIMFINSITESPFRSINIDNILFIIIISLLAVYNSIYHKKIFKLEFIKYD